MSYYNVLSAASELLLQQHLTMRRCRRRFNGPHRYVLFDTHGSTVHFNSNTQNRRSGYTLREVLEWLAAHSDINVAKTAQSLLQELEAWHQIKAAI
jgi:hypothetical protein